MSISTTKINSTQHEWFEKETGVKINNRLRAFPKSTFNKNWTGQNIFNPNNLEYTRIYHMRFDNDNIYIDIFSEIYPNVYMEKHFHVIKKEDYESKPSLFGYVQDVFNIANGGKTKKELYIESIKNKLEIRTFLRSIANNDI